MDARQVMSRLTELLLLSDTAYTEIARQNGLTYNALMALYMLDDDPQTTQKDICDTLHLSKSTVHSIIQDLSGHGLVYLTAGSNKKEKYIALTEQGAQLLDKIMVQTTRIEYAALQAFDEKELRAFLSTAEKLSARLVAEANKEYKIEGEFDEA